MPGPRPFPSLPRAFFDRPTVRVARDLLGTRLARRVAGEWRLARLVETEAYVARDPASHAFRGPTPRTRSMFGGPGTLYVFRIHQVHCAKVVTRPGQAVLLRAAEPLSPGLGDLRGPGRLCRAFQLTRAEDGADLVVGPLRLLPRDRPRGRVVRGPRVGLSRARERPLRFAIADNPWVSRPRPGPRAGPRG